MANEISVLEQRDDQQYVLLFLFPISSPVQINGSNIIVTPSAGLPDLGALILSGAEKTALDAGTIAFEVFGFNRDPALSGAETLARARELYAARKARFDADYAARYANTGDRFNATA